MKSKYRNILIGTAIASILGITGAAFAHGGAYGGGWQQGAQAQQGWDGTGPRMGMGGMQGGMGPGFGLGLSDEQKTEMGKIREEILPLMSELRGKMQANHEQLRALRQSGSTDQAAITKLADQKGDLIAEMI
jgi:Spy/CpxP family protein refolding chaperone